MEISNNNNPDSDYKFGEIQSQAVFGSDDERRKTMNRSRSPTMNQVNLTSSKDF